MTNPEPATPRRDPVACPRCGETDIEWGFIDDYMHGKVRWISGEPEYGVMGNARWVGRHLRIIRAERCTRCSRLQLFADIEPD